MLDLYVAIGWILLAAFVAGSDYRPARSFVVLMAVALAVENLIQLAVDR